MPKKLSDMTKTIKTSDIELNNGQIDGLPKNPRFIRDNQFESLKQSLRDFPEMLNLRELIVYPYDGKYIVIAGNMRFRAGKELGMTEFPCKVLSKETTIDRLKEITIKDNNSFGEWDYDQLANEWDSNKLGEWGVEAVNWYQDENTSESDDTEIINDYEGKEIDINDIGEKIIIKFEFTPEEWQFINSSLQKVDANKENALLKLLKYGK